MFEKLGGIGKENRGDSGFKGTNTSARANAEQERNSALQASRTGGWSVLIASFSGPDAASAAQQGLAKVLARTGLRGAYVDERGPAHVIALGDYAAPEDPRAQQDLAMVRAAEVDGTKPFADAVLAPPPAGLIGVQGTLGEFDLLSVRGAAGSGVMERRVAAKNAVYTLQVGIYKNLDGTQPDAKELAEFRRAAERAVVDLRAQGEEAYYYHSPRASTVTIGLFSERDYNVVREDEMGLKRSGRARESMALLESRRAHPYTLVNGQGLRIRRGGQSADGARTSDGADTPQGTLQPSVIVRVPDK